MNDTEFEEGDLILYNMSSKYEVCIMTWNADHTKLLGKDVVDWESDLTGEDHGKNMWDIVQKLGNPNMFDDMEVELINFGNISLEDFKQSHSMYFV